MIVDSSALIAILRDEPERERFADILVREPSRMSAANWFEAAMVADGTRRPEDRERFDEIISTAEVVIEPVTVEQAKAARIAFRRYGRGSGSRAKLNFGDCFAYALSATSGEPLLFKGDDFAHTDILRAV